MMRFSLFILLCLTSWTVQATADGYGRVTPDGRAAVATVQPLATEAGLAALARGGNAIDAAVAAALTLGVVDSHNSGIGGGAFVLVRWADGSIEAIDGREIAPRAAHRDMYLRDGQADPELSRTGALAVGVPGSLMAYDYLVNKGGKRSLADALLPAAELAEQGFAIDGIFAQRLVRNADTLRQFPASARVLLDADGQPWSVGHRLVQQDLANTYRGIARQGIRHFYSGEFAVRTAAWMRENQGIVTLQDFADYRLSHPTPVISDYRGHRIYGFPPPSSGGVHVAQILNILEAFDLTAVSEAERLHLIAEVMKLAFADRAYWLGDPAFASVPKGLMSPEYAADLAKRIDPAKASAVSGHSTPPNAGEDLFDKHTTHIAAADAEGNWVAITTTVNTSFGSKVIVPGTGVVLNNQMDDFSAQPGAPNAFGLVGADANSIAPGKRPLSSMSPTLVVRDGKPVLTLGAAGGPTIISQVALTLINHLALNMPLPEAVAAPRIHQQWRPDVLSVEAEVPAAVQTALEAKGHSLRTFGGYGSTQAIGLDKEGGFVSVAEPRLESRNQTAQ